MRGQIKRQRGLACGTGADLDSQGTALLRRLAISEPSEMTESQLQEAMLAAEFFATRARTYLSASGIEAGAEVDHGMARFAG